MIRLAIFASGNGSNAENIARYFSDNKEITICLILTNNPDAGVIERADRLGISVETFNRDDFYNTNKVINILNCYSTDFIILAGFLWLVPENILTTFENRIVNIHPALLPNYGGKGMYGMNVHKAIIDAGEKESGITIHFVNKNYDEGQTIFQATVNIDKEDTPDTLAKKIHTLEYQYFPRIIEETIKNLTI